MKKRKEPRYAPGQELTLHPGDPVKGAELLEERQGGKGKGEQERPDEEPRTVHRFY